VRVNADAAKRRKKPPSPNDSGQSMFLEESVCFSPGPPNRKIMGDVQTGLQRNEMSGKNIVGGKRFM